MAQSSKPAIDNNNYLFIRKQINREIGRCGGLFKGLKIAYETNETELIDHYKKLLESTYLTLKILYDHLATSQIEYLKWRQSQITEEQNE